MMHVLGKSLGCLSRLSAYPIRLPVQSFTADFFRRVNTDECFREVAWVPIPLECLCIFLEAVLGGLKMMIGCLSR